jgi:LPS export ABC transporter permease LptG
VTLVGIFLIFTLFELWRYIAATKSGFTLITQYLFFLLPFVIVQITPAAILIAALSTYALMARRSENIAWWASGQSVYRLFAPGVLFAIAVGIGIWYLQESVLPMSNMRQDSLRAQLKNPGLPRMVTNTGRQWLASSDSQRIYAFDYIDQPNTVHSFSVFQFDASGTHLSRILRAENAQWNEKGDIDLQNAEVFTFNSALLEHERSPHFQFENGERFELFKPAIDKPSQLNSQQLSAYIKLNKQRGAAVAALVVALYRKYAEPFGALVMMMIGAPLALSFGRKNVVAGLCVSILVGVAFWGTSGGFQQLGAFGMLPGAVAAIGPFVIFGSVGLYLLSRTRT